MKKKIRTEPAEVQAAGISAPEANLISSQITVEAVTTLDVTPTYPGNPIMRDDFITRTGFMPPKHH